MALGLNKVILIGNVGKDPEFRNVSDGGKQLAVFSFATTESWRNKANGEKKESTEWHRIVVFNDGLVEIIKQYVKKGTKLYIEGSLKTRKWVDSNGQEKFTTEVVLQNYNAVFILLDNKASPGEDRTHNYNGYNAVTQELNDEIPF